VAAAAPPPAGPAGGRARRDRCARRRRRAAARAPATIFGLSLGRQTRLAAAHACRGKVGSHPAGRKGLPARRPAPMLSATMRLLPLCLSLCLLAPAVRAEPDEISAVQKRPLRASKRLELWAYGSMSIADPYLQRWGGGLRGMYHLREGLSVGLDASGLGT